MIVSRLSPLVAVSIAVLAALSAAAEPFPGRPDPAPLLGTPAPALALKDWIQASPLEMEDLRGQVVLIRWWTDTCPFCSSSAPALRRIHERYAADGLRVIGVFHPKPAAERSAAVERAAAGARRFGFDFPIAVDADWTALRRWWLRHFDGWTSISFLVDKRGTIRFVHPGGEYHTGAGGAHWRDHTSCHREYAALTAEIERLLAE